MDFLDALCEDAWLSKNKEEALQVFLLFIGDLNPYHHHLLVETISGPDPITDYEDKVKPADRVQHSLDNFLSKWVY